MLPRPFCGTLLLPMIFIFLALFPHVSPFSCRNLSTPYLRRAPQGLKYLTSNTPAPTLNPLCASLQPKYLASTAHSVSSLEDYHVERRRTLLSTASNKETIKYLSKQKSVLPGSFALASATVTLLSISLIPSLPFKLLLSSTLGGVASVWQLQVLHDALHSTFSSSARVNEWVLFYFSLPAFVGYYTYLKFGHLGHHNLVSSRERIVGLREIFDSPESSVTNALLDGDALFARHRQVVGGEEGPLWHGEVS